jgi:hypothetical protein
VLWLPPYDAGEAVAVPAPLYAGGNRMTVIHAQLIGDKAIIARGELDQLLELARRSGQVEVALDEEETPTWAIMRLAEQGGAFDFWQEEGEDIYSVTDGEPL